MKPNILNEDLSSSAWLGEYLTSHAVTVLGVANITTVRDLVQKTEQDLIRLRSFGKGSLRAVKDMLAFVGLHLGMTNSEIDDYIKTNYPPSAEERIMSKYDTPEFQEIVAMAEEMKLITAILQILLPMRIKQRDRVMRTVHVWLSPGTIQNVLVTQ